MFKITATPYALYALSLPLFKSTAWFPSSTAYFTGGLYKYNFHSGSWARINKTIVDVDMNKSGIVISPTDSNVMYYGGIRPYVSFDEGHDFTDDIGQIYGNPTHADIRAISIQHAGVADSGKGDRVYLATDGGVSKKPAGINMRLNQHLSTIDISGSGLTCGTFNGFATSEADGGIGIGGMMHDGVVAYEPGKNPQWKSLNVSDAWTGAFDKTQPTKAYFWWDIGVVKLSETGNSSGRVMDTFAYQFPSPKLPKDPAYPGVGAPIETDNNGNIYCVKTNFWRKEDTATAFRIPSLPALGLGFPNSDLLFGACMAFDPNATEYTGYVLYYGHAPEIYYRNPSLGASASKISSVPGSDCCYNVLFLTTDHSNTEHVWVCQGGVNYRNDSTTLFRVHYSPDHGTTWIDISNGLPARVPATRIVFDETTNMLYCATDAGIYKCDFGAYNSAHNYFRDGHWQNKVVQWQCFSQGAGAGPDFPNVPVQALVINHCSGKLFAGTYGRSIWSADMNPPGTIITPRDTIWTSTLWNTGKHHYITGGIVVPPGVVLTIKDDTVHMPKGGLIDIMPGGKLEVDHALITNSCEGCMWQGIQARGRATEPQDAIYQGWVLIKNGSTIEHAIVATANSKTDSIWATNGGIIQASNSYFLNNQTSVSFEGYSNFDKYGTGKLRPNVSRFSDCHFVLDNGYKGTTSGLRLKNMVKLNAVEGVSFAGCEFRNSNKHALNKGNGVGIKANNASFNVGPYYCPGCVLPSRSRFSGFSTGIDIRNLFTTGLAVSIHQADFDTVTIGEYVSAYNNVSTTECDFKIGRGKPADSVNSDGLAGCSQNIGIYTKSTQLFRIENNSFRQVQNYDVDYYSSPWYNFGTVVASSGGVANRIYRNTFDSLNCGLLAIGNNKYGSHPVTGYSIGTGLQVTCNTFSNNNKGITIVDDGKGGPSKLQGIGNMQGMGGASAGNTFSGTTNSIVNTCSEFIDYYYSVCSQTKVDLLLDSVS